MNVELFALFERVEEASVKAAEVSFGAHKENLKRKLRPATLEERNLLREQKKSNVIPGTGRKSAVYYPGSDEEGGKVAKRRKTEESIKLLETIAKECKLGNDAKAQVDQIRHRFSQLSNVLRTVRQQLIQYDNGNKADELHEKLQEEENHYQEELAAREEHIRVLEGVLQNKRTKLESLEDQLVAVYARREAEKASGTQQDELSVKLSCAQEMVSDLEKQIRNITTEIADHDSVLRSYVSSPSKPKKRMTAPTPDDVRKTKTEAVKLTQEVTRLKQELQERERAAAAAVDENAELLQIKSEIESESELIRSSNKTLQTVEDKITQVRSLSERVMKKKALEGNVFAAALSFVHSHLGEMLLTDLKQELSSHLTTSGMGGGESKATQIIYQLVANSLLKIDRTHQDNSVLLLL